MSEKIDEILNYASGTDLDGYSDEHIRELHASGAWESITTKRKKVIMEAIAQQLRGYKHIIDEALRDIDSQETESYKPDSLFITLEDLASMVGLYPESQIDKQTPKRAWNILVRNIPRLSNPVFRPTFDYTGLPLVAAAVHGELNEAPPLRAMGVDSLSALLCHEVLGFFTGWGDSCDRLLEQAITHKRSNAEIPSITALKSGN